MNCLEKFKKFNDELSKAKVKRDTLNGLVDKLLEKISELDCRADEIDKIMTVLRLIIETRQDTVVKLFEDTVASALQETFNENYGFKIDINTRNKSSSLDFLINTGEYDGFIPIKHTQGKSVSDIISVIIRIMFISLLDCNKIVVLDESLGGVERDREMVVGRFIRNVSEKFGIQIVMVSHKSMIAESADRIIEI